MKPELPENLEFRILGLLDGTLSEDEVAQLDEELRSDRDARDLYRKLSLLHVTLKEQAAARSGLDQVPVIPIEQLLARQQKRVVKGSFIAAAAVLMISAVVLWVNMVPPQPRTLGQFRVGSGAIFSVDHAEADDEASLRELRKGSQLHVKSGAVEVTFVSGVRCVVEGPAHLQLLADDRVKLPRGSAWFKVPHPAIGFAVETPQLVAVDLGTQFGVLVQPDQGDQVHVIDGLVSVKAAGAPAGRSPIELEAGNAREALNGGEFRKIELNPGRFATSLPNPITFIDANVSRPAGNTTLDGPGSFGPNASVMTRANDHKWSLRTRPAVTGGSILESADGEDAGPRLRTTFRLPEEGQYAVYGYFWNNQNGQGAWDVAFQLGSRGKMRAFSRHNASNLVSIPEEFSTSVPMDDGDGQVLFQATLGVWDTERDGSEVTVFIDDGDSGNTGMPGSDLRTWYDGVGFRRLPEN